MGDDGEHSGHRARMRVRLLEGGGEAFLDHELIEYVLGLAIPRRDTKPLAKRLIAEFGSFAAVVSAQPTELARIEGLGDGAAAALKFVGVAAVRMLREGTRGRPLLGSWQSVMDYLHADMAHNLVERFRVLFLNARNVLIRDEVMGEGTVNQTPVYVREVMKRALELGATSIVLVHNHPSGDPKPSRDDIRLTEDMIKAARALGIAVHDHVIIGANGHASFATMGLMA